MAFLRPFTNSSLLVNVLLALLVLIGIKEQVRMLGLLYRNDDFGNHSPASASKVTRFAANSSSVTHKIPHRLVFIHTKFTAPEQLQPHFYDNIMNTVTMYRREWNEPDAPVWFLGQEACESAIRAAEPRLLPYFLNEPRGDYQADICRVAALYTQGGYYFDVDMRTLQPIIFDTVEFATPYCARPNCLFNSFLASVSNSAILRKNLDIMLEHYQSRSNGIKSDTFRGALMGVGTLMAAYAETPASERGVTYTSLKEMDLGRYGVTYPKVPRQKGIGSCNYAVVDRRDHVVHFFSRIVNSGRNCLPCKKTWFGTTWCGLPFKIPKILRKMLFLS